MSKSAGSVLRMRVSAVADKKPRKFGPFPQDQVTSIRLARNADIEAVTRFVRERREESEIKMDFDGTDADLRNLERNYTLRGGVFVVLYREEAIVGTIALYPRTETTAELRKFYLIPSLQGLGLGQILLNQLIAEARLLGYLKIELETLSRLGAANELYSQAGFQPNTERTAVHPQCDMVLQLRLDDSEPQS